ncbi:TAXI family TRAP transporter solute-binding subunit [Asanoa iriomotensis]|uniref:TAXI family TRAP transporter solute-binding subunit n=1 Tax=Asanoa iriomotensis TaxID=234613 RepID=A0ABQ4C3R8_9ACTN|nr:TAXI family TRAP transporter solute-binding subunit [Asanoa iriomotensis]GIF57402.1 hypothetical protein Air01nite_34970 [Asanoa iriomotensis]
MSKSLKFAGSAVGEPWWVLGDITRRLLEPLGYEVEVLSASGSTNNPRYVGGGKADLGASVPQTIGWAIAGEHLYQGETFAELRAIGRVRRPSWLVAAARHELGFTSLHQIAQSDYPVRLLTHDLESIASVVPKQVMEYYGLTKEAVEAKGGSVRKIGQGDFRAGDIDVILANLYMGRSAVTKHWIDASVLLNLRFFDFDDELLAQLAANGHGGTGEVPFHFLRGVDKPVKALNRHDGILIYLPADTDEEFVYDLTKLYDSNRDLFFNQAVHMAWDPAAVVKTSPLQLHAGAERYYKEAGLL